MKKSPYDSTIESIDKKVGKEREKYICGEKNQYFAWCDFKDCFSEAYAKFMNEAIEEAKKIKEEREKRKRKEGF